MIGDFYTSGEGLVATHDVGVVITATEDESELEELFARADEQLRDIMGIVRSVPQEDVKRLPVFAIDSQSTSACSSITASRTGSEAVSDASAETAHAPGFASVALTPAASFVRNESTDILSACAVGSSWSIDSAETGVVPTPGAESSSTADNNSATPVPAAFLSKFPDILTSERRILFRAHSNRSMDNDKPFARQDSTSSIFSTESSAYLSSLSSNNTSPHIIERSLSNDVGSPRSNPTRGFASLPSSPSSRPRWFGRKQQQSAPSAQEHKSEEPPRRALGACYKSAALACLRKALAISGGSVAGPGSTSVPTFQFPPSPEMQADTLLGDAPAVRAEEALLACAHLVATAITLLEEPDATNARVPLSPQSAEASDIGSPEDSPRKNRMGFAARFARTVRDLTQ